MNGTMKRWLILALGAAMAAVSVGCVAPAEESDDDEAIDVSTSDQPLGVVENLADDSQDGAPQQNNPGAVPAEAGYVSWGEDCMDPEPQPWEPPGKLSDDGDDDDSDGDGDGDDRRTLSHTILSAPTGGRGR
jgi:hypothetical protein